MQPVFPVEASQRTSRWNSWRQWRRKVSYMGMLSGRLETVQSWLACSRLRKGIAWDISCKTMLGTDLYWAMLNATPPRRLSIVSLHRRGHRLCFGWRCNPKCNEWLSVKEPPAISHLTGSANRIGCLHTLLNASNSRRTKLKPRDSLHRLHRLHLQHLCHLLLWAEISQRFLSLPLQVSALCRLCLQNQVLEPHSLWA